jgi:hypothetical protein
LITSSCGTRLVLRSPRCRSFELECEL